MSPLTTEPLVSCVMPTTARRRLFVPQAIRYFQRQDYRNKELLIVDDGEESIEELVPDDAQVRYVRLTGKRTLGSKRNLCVEAARGDLIMHWDDDDWASPARIGYQVEALVKANAEACGLKQMLFYELATGRAWLYRYRYEQRAWLAGGSLLYTRQFWRRSPFPDAQVGSDTTFVWNQKMDKALALSDYSFYVAMIHTDNTSAKNCRGDYWSPWHGALESLVGADYAFYLQFLKDSNKQAAAPSRIVESRSRLAISLPAKVNEPSIKPAAETLKATSRHVPAFTQTNGRKPKVSCILATGNRPSFARQAIRCFLRQTFDDAELIVVDDGNPSIADLCAGLFRVSHIRLDEPTTLGSKLNIGIEHSSGSLIQKLDDDDFYQQDFLSRSVGALEQSKEERAVVTWDCFTILMAGERHVRYSGHGWTTGGTLCFRKGLWEKHPFRDLPRRVDAWFIEDNAPRLVRVCAPELYMLVRHGRNTWTRLSNDAPVDDYFKSLPPHRRPLDDIIEPIDRLFYHSLKEGGVG